MSVLLDRFRNLFFKSKSEDAESRRPLLMPDSETPLVVPSNSDLETSPPERRGRWTSLNKDQFIEYCKKFCFATLWVALLVVNYCIGRLFVRWELPSDAEENLDAYDVYESINNLLLYGLVLGWFAGITETERVLWLFHWKRWYFLALFLGVGPVYSWISNAEELKHSFEDVDEWGSTMWSVIILAIILVAISVIWHLYFAFKNHSFYGMLVFVFSRVMVILYYWIFAVQMEDTHHRDVHLHHYFTGWMAALFAEFNHPISSILLGTMSAVFVQGISAYGFAPLFNDEECVSITTSRNATCYFASQEKFRMHMCPGKRDDVALRCYEGVPKHSLSIFD